MLTIVLWLRLRHLLGETAYLQFLSGAPLADFIVTARKCVVIYAQADHHTRQSLEYTNPTISLYREYVDFAMGDPESAPKNVCRQFPCFVDSTHGRVISIGQPGNTTGRFLNWVDEVAHPRLRPVVSVSRLNQILNVNSSVLFGVDLQEPPKRIPEERTLYLVASDLFRIFNLSLERGLYVYRPNDCEIIRISSFSEFEGTEQTGISQFSEVVSLSPQKKLIGCVLDQRDSPKRPNVRRF
jgi:hypothetical protein